MFTQELLEAEAANIKPIEEEIEDERRKVEAKTPITEEVSCLFSLCMLKVLDYQACQLSIAIPAGHTFTGSQHLNHICDRQRPVH